MRIICPNCNAQYEVGEEMIPADGRDVQCSNCGTTWFQARRSRDAEASEAPVVPPSEAEAEETAAPSKEPAKPVPKVEAPRQRGADPRALDILREEGERESRLRAAEGVTADEKAISPPGAEPPARDPREAAAAERVRLAAAAALARARDTEADRQRPPGPAAPAEEIDEFDDGDDDDLYPDVALTPVRPARRDLLPDIEEINSSLRPDERTVEAEARAAANADAPEVARRRKGFRVGFLSVGAVVLALVALYVFAVPISEAVPDLAEPLLRYLAWIDLQRLALLDAAESLTAQITPDT